MGALLSKPAKPATDNAKSIIDKARQLNQPSPGAIAPSATPAQKK